MMRTVLPHQVQYLQHHLALLCPWIATRQLFLLHLSLLSWMHLRDLTSHLDLSRPVAPAAFQSPLSGLQPITCARLKAVPHFQGQLLTQPFPFQHSRSHQLSRLWSLTSVLIH